MAGRGGGQGGFRNLAAGLNIQRGEISALGKYNTLQSNDWLFPPLRGTPLPLLDSEDVNYLAELKQELTNRFQESVYYLKPSSSASSHTDIVRYTDKYKTSNGDRYVPRFERLPKELRWGTAKTANGEPPKKRRRLDNNSIGAKLETLERAEKTVGKEGATDEQTEEAKKGKKNANDSRDEEDEERDDDELQYSDEDHNEEENDYATNYFDNGENYLDEDEDNLDDES